MSKAVPAKKSVVDAFIAKDRVAVFWFMAAVVVGGGCSWYLTAMSQQAAQRPPFVVMDGAGTYYIAIGQNFDRADEMHKHLTEIAVMALFQRGPEGLLNSGLLDKLTIKTSRQKLRLEIGKEDEYFRRQQVTQSYMLAPVDPIAIVGRAATAVVTSAKGTIRRNFVLDGRALEEEYTFEVRFKWLYNPDPRGNRAFPAVIVDFVPPKLVLIKQ